MDPYETSFGAPWWGPELVGEFLGRWESPDGQHALVAFQGREVVGLLFGVRLGANFRPVEARFVSRTAFPEDESRVLAMMERWSRELPPDVASLSTTAMRELPMGQMVANLIDQPGQTLMVDVGAVLTEDVEHAAINSARNSEFRSARELRSRIQQLKASYYYVTAVAAGDSAPLDAVVHGLALSGSSPRARAGTLIQYARKNGYLSESVGAGRAGGDLTPLALTHVSQIAALGGRHV